MGCTTDSTATPKDSADVHAALSRFVRAFDDLDMEDFRASFAEDAVVFFPDWPPAVVGRDSVVAHFRLVFDARRRAVPSGPPYLNITPVDLQITMLGPTSALATFELHNPAGIGRRTMVLRKNGADWRITELHASNVAVVAHPPR